MLGKVLIFVFIAIVLTGVAVLGFANVLQDAARMRQIDSQTQHQEALWAAAAPYEQQKAAADANYDIAATNAAGTRALAQADADAIRARADAQAYANQQALAAYQTAVRGQQALDREKLIGQIAIYAGGLLIVVLVLTLGFAAFRLIARLVPMPAPRPAAAQPAARPAARPRPAPTLLRRRARQPVRQPAPVMPATKCIWPRMPRPTAPPRSLSRAPPPTRRASGRRPGV
ncbi:MAG: hypothetical protein KIT52_00480 [Anaerolineae bacterium]|nr:hypothetical protein [Anaerolineae bacterium]